MESMRSESIPIDHDGTISYQVVSKIARWKFSQIFTILSTWNPNSILIFNKCVNKSKLWALVKCLYIIYVLKGIEFSRMGTGYHTHLLSLVSKEKFYVVLRSLIKMLDWEWTESVSIDDLFLAVRIVKLDTQRLWWHREKTPTLERRAMVAFVEQGVGAWTSCFFSHISDGNVGSTTSRGSRNGATSEPDYWKRCKNKPYVRGCLAAQTISQTWRRHEPPKDLNEINKQMQQRTGGQEW